MDEYKCMMDLINVGEEGSWMLNDGKKYTLMVADGCIYGFEVCDIVIKSGDIVEANYKDVMCYRDAEGSYTFIF